MTGQDTQALHIGPYITDGDDGCGDSGDDDWDDVGDNDGDGDFDLDAAYDEYLEYLFDVSGTDYEITNLRYDDDYADIVANMKAAIDGYVSSVTEFGISGNF